MGQWIRKRSIPNSWKFYGDFNKQTEDIDTIQGLQIYNSDLVLEKCDNEVQSIPIKVTEQFRVWTGKYRCEIKEKLRLAIYQFSVCCFHFVFLEQKALAGITGKDKLWSECHPVVTMFQQGHSGKGDRMPALTASMKTVYQCAKMKGRLKHLVACERPKAKN